MPSSAATRAASATTGFVTEAQPIDPLRVPAAAQLPLAGERCDGDVLGRPGVGGLKGVQSVDTRGDEADLSVEHHGNRVRRRRERPRARVREDRPVHARRGGGVHAPRLRVVRSRPAHRHVPGGGRRARARGADEGRADAVGARDRDAGVRLGGGRRPRAAQAPRVRRVGREPEVAARRLGGDASVQPLRGAADHGPRPVPRARRPDAVRGAPRADLRAPHPCRGRRRGEGDPGRERAPRRAADPARALCELALLARRGDRARVDPADGLRRLPALGAAAPLPRLRGLRGGRRAAREDRLHRGLHAHLVGHPPAPAPRDRRDPDLRRGHARRARRRAGRVLPGAGQVLLRALRPGRRDPLVPPDPDEREQVARRPLRARGAADGPRDRVAEPAAPWRSSCAAG